MKVLPGLRSEARPAFECFCFHVLVAPRCLPLSIDVPEFGCITPPLMATQALSSGVILQRAFPRRDARPRILEIRIIGFYP